MLAVASDYYFIELLQYNDPESRLLYNVHYTKVVVFM